VVAGESGRGAGGLSVEKLLAGMALKKAWSRVQIGSGPKEENSAPKKQRRVKERYQVFHKISGEQSAAKRIDYR
jgi:hypothetical protein